MKRPLALYMLLFLLFVSCGQKSEKTVFSGSTMGTTYRIVVKDISDSHEKERVNIAINAALTTIDNVLNVYNPKSQISGLNHHQGQGAYPVSPELIEVSKVAETVYELSGGAYDPTLKPLIDLWGFGDRKRGDAHPGKSQVNNAMRHMGMDKLKIFDNAVLKTDEELMLDYSSIAKGYGVDLVSAAIYDLGYKDFLVEIGGEIYASGSNGDKQWRIGVAAPERKLVFEGYVSTTLDLENMACATSGDYQQYYIYNGQRFSHLIDARSGYPIDHHVTSVTVAAKSCILADALATAAIVLGPEEGLELIRSVDDVEALFISRSGELYTMTATDGWEDLVQP